MRRSITGSTRSPSACNFDKRLQIWIFSSIQKKSPALIQAKATGSPLSGFKVKRGAVVPLSVTVLGAQNATALRMGIKAKGNYEGDLLILAEAAAGSQTELGTRLDLKLMASSLALNDALDVGEGSATPPAPPR